MRRAALLATLVTVVAASMLACGDAPAAAERSTRIRALTLPGVPAKLVGLDVRSEDVNERLKSIQRTYVEAVALYSLRSNDDLVQATLQINRFKASDRYTTSSFRTTIVNQIGSTRPRQTVMGGTAVWRTTDTKQRVAVWFHGRHMFLLSVREDFGRPRTLIRDTLGLRP